MARLIFRSAMRRLGLVAGCVPLALLTGCPPEQRAGAAQVPAQATAPVIKNNAAVQSAATPAARTTAQTVENGAKAFRAQQLVAQAKTTYNSGVANYRAGHLDSARLDFDAAIDLMLTSGMDLKNDPQLADEFDQLLSAVNSLEMGALKQGNGFSAKLEEAPLDSAENLTFAPNPALTAKLKAELVTKSDLPLLINDEVAGYIGYFANSTAFRAHMVHSLARAGKYRAIIQKALADQGLPQDLFYLAVAESGFQPQALNPKSGAGGMWQFMPTGAYGLARNGYFDERFDPEKSSIAYAKYMKTLYNQFGDWYLAMAGYDWGPGNVQRAVMKTGYADFWQLYRRGVLPKETKEYVPKILAAVIMAKNPVKYGLDKVVPDAAVVLDTVTVEYAADLRLVADVTGATLNEIVALNPSLLRMSTPKDMPFDLHIPVGTKDVFAERMDAIPEEKRASWRFHVVRAGESLDGIAATLHARAGEIATANGLKADAGVQPGDALVIPMASAIAAAGTHPARYTVRKGDTLITVADRFNVSVDQLRRWNRLKSSGVRVGSSLSVAEPVKFGPITRVRGKGSRSRGASVVAGKAAGKNVKSGSASTKSVATKSRAAKSAGVKGSSTHAAVTKTKATGQKLKRKAAR